MIPLDVSEAPAAAGSEVTGQDRATLVPPSGTGEVPAGAPLVVDGVRVSLGGREVLTGASLHVASGELVGLIGPNGAGKTTLLRTILGLLKPTSGQVRVDGRPTRPGRTPIGYVPQRHEFAWDFPLSVAHVVASGLTGRLGLLRRPRTADWEAVADALDRVRMTEFAERPVGQLSGGQRQRVLVARALALRPSLLLLDEPYTGLDMPTQELLDDLFVGLAHEGRAVLMTTHDLPSALYSCDRLALINREVVATGDAGSLAEDTDAWTSTFGIGADSPLLRILRAAARDAADASASPHELSGPGRSIHRPGPDNSKGGAR